VYHANYHCNAGCAFCSRAADIANAEKRKDVDIRRVEMIFREVRELVGALYIAGGEPLLQRNIEQILYLAREVGFFPVAINTNATLLRERPLVPRYADQVVVSLHTVKVAQAAKIFRVRHRIAEQALENILWAVAEAKKYGNRVVANCVLTEDTIRGANDVLDFCLKYGITLAVVPAIENYLPTIGSANEEVLIAYRAFLDRVIRVKQKNPGAIQGTQLFLRRIRDLRKFHCRPTGILSITPTGEIINPCDYKYRGLPEHLGKISSDRSLRSMLEEQIDFKASFRGCDKNCLKACYAEPAMVIEDPWLAAAEYLPIRTLFDRIRYG